MADIVMRAFDLTQIDDSDIMTQPFSLSDTDPIVSERKTNIMTGEEFSKLAKINPTWNDPEWKKTSAVETFGAAKTDLTKPEEFIASTSQGFIDEIANFPDKIKNEAAQIVIESYEDKNKLAQRLVGLVSKAMPKLPVGTNPEDLVKKIVEKSDIFKPQYDEKLINTLDGREYPMLDWAKKTMAETTKAIQDREFARVLQAEQRGIDREAWSNEIGRTIGAMMPVIALGKGVGTAAKALGATAETATAISGAAMKSGTLAQMTGDYAYTTAAQYVEKTGDKDFTNFTPQDANGISALGYGAIGTMIEYGFGGIEPLFASGMSKLGTNNILKSVGKIAAGEAWEEFLQEWEEFLFRTVDGSNTRTWGETLKDSLKSAVYGGLIGGAIGDVAYRTNRRNIANALVKTTGMDYDFAVKVADAVIEDTGTEIFKRADENLSLMNKQGETYQRLTTGIKTTLETAGWAENILDPQTQQPKNIDIYADLIAQDLTAQVIRQASLSGLSPNEFMDVSAFQAIDNVVFLKPLGDRADIKAQIEAQDAIIKRERELKKTGAGDNKKLQEARMRKNILEKAYNIKEYQDKKAKEQIERQKTPESVKEIETATKDAEIVKNTPKQEDFNAKVGDNLTTAEKTKRYGNAVIKRILPTKTDFDAVMVDPKYSNAKNAIITVAPRISDFIKAHRTYGLKTDLMNALKKMQTVNQGNFIESISYPALDGVDVIAENAFLYHFLFCDETTISKFLDSYITRAEQSLSGETNVPLSKKDLVGQAFKATDDMMQTQAQLTNTEYQSIYDTTGNIVDKNVLAVMLSYQNQFVQEQGQQIPEYKQRYREQNKKDVARIMANAKPVTVDQIKQDFKTVVAQSDKAREQLYATGDDSGFAKNTQHIYVARSGDSAWYWRVTPTGRFERINKYSNNNSYAMAGSGYSDDVNRLDEVVSKIPDIRFYEIPVKDFENLSDEFLRRDYPSQILEQFDLADENARLDDIYPAYEGETITVNGKDRSVYNSAGERIAKSEPALRNFYRWFGDSKVVDEQGRPLVVYHGTKALFDTFDTTTIGKASGNAGFYGTGFYFTDKQNEAQIYAETAYVDDVPLSTFSGMTYEQAQELMKKNAVVMPLYLKSENPFMWDNIKTKAEADRISKQIGMPLSWNKTYKEINRFTHDSKSRLFSEKLKELGYDGVIKGIEFVAFEPNQIKSVDNRGTYSADTGNIYYQGKKANGFYDPELGVIVLGRNMNEMTLPHEMQHYWLDTIFNIYKRAKSGELQVKAGWLESTKDLLNMLGIDENQAQLTKPQQEKFSRMSEAYLTGLGVDPAQNQTFREYLKWVPEKYKSIANIGYLGEDGLVKLPYLDDAAVEFFNKWYENPSLPTLPNSPERQRFINPTDDKGEVTTVSIKEMNDRNKEFGQDAEEQIHADERLYNTLEENMSAEIKTEADGQRVIQESRSNFLKESEKQQRRWFEHKSRDTEAQKAQEYIEKNLDHAKEIVYGDPELIPNDSGIDRATLINAYIATQDIKVGSDDWARLQTNIAINQSLAGTQLALSNDKSYRTYLDALRKVEQARELKAATNYAGAKEGALDKFNADIKAFVESELSTILGTEPDSQERELAIKSMFERARTTFSGNTTGSFLTQEDFNFAKRQKGMSQAFVTWAVNQIKKDAGAKLKPAEQAKLMEISAKAQQALVDIDDRNAGKAVAGAQEISKWQVERDKLSLVSPRKASLFGDYAARAMLFSFNTLVVANVPSTAMNTFVTRVASNIWLEGNSVSKSLTDSEIDRIKKIWMATGMNLAQMENPTSPSLLHGEKYSTSGQKIYDPFTILGWEDNLFRVPAFVNTLARIATADAKTTGQNPNEVFKEYCKLNNQSDAAKLARKQAIAVANMAVFTQDGMVSRTLNHIRSDLNRLSRAAIGLDPEGFGLGSLISPFLKTGANIAEMGVRGVIAPLRLAVEIGRWVATGKAIDPLKKIALTMDAVNFLLSSAAVALLAALTSDDDDFYTEPYEMGKKYDPNKPYDSINIGGVWIDLDFFGPFAIPIRAGCIAVKQWKTDNGIVSNIGRGLGHATKFAAMDTPLVESLFNNQIDYATKKPGDWALGYGYNIVNRLVPAQLKPLSRVISRETGIDWSQDTGWMGKVIQRKFHRNYGFEGAEPTTQDWIDVFTTRLTIDQRKE